MKRLIKWLFLLILLTFMVLLGLFVSTFDNNALVTPRGELTKKELAEISWLVRRNSPLRQTTRKNAAGVLSERELNLAGAYLIQTRAGRYRESLSTRIDLLKSEARVDFTLKLPDNPLGQYLNLTTRVQALGEEAPFLKIGAIRVGKYDLPEIVVKAISNVVYKEIEENSIEFEELEKSIRSVHIRKEKMIVGYQLAQNSLSNVQAHLGTMVISGELKQALMVYSAYLAKRTHALPDRVNMTDLMRTMFYEAHRSHEELSARVENQAIFITMAAFILDRDIPELLGETTQQKAKKKMILLDGREDLSKHFLVSAAIASLANPALAEVIGLEKEIYDAQGGSGFSYADLAADESGIHLARYASSSEETANRMQVYLSGGLRETDIMPSLKSLPEGIQQNQQGELVDRSSEAYGEMKALVIQRIRNLPVYKSKKG